VLQTSACWAFWNIPLNPANLIALTLILGIGVDYGVHYHPRLSRTAGDIACPPSAAVAVVVDSSTTIVGFGSLMVASHQRLVSLGRVLTLGVTCCLFIFDDHAAGLTGLDELEPRPGDRAERFSPNWTSKRSCHPSDVATRRIPPRVDRNRSLSNAWNIATQSQITVPVTTKYQ